MLRVYKLPPWVFLLGFIALVGLIVVSLPVFLFFSGIIFLMSILRNLLGFRKRSTTFRTYSTPQEDSNVSAPIHNKRIGTYRIKKSEDDPNVIEVVDED